MTKTLITFDISEDVKIAKLIGRREDIIPLVDDALDITDSICAFLDGKLIGGHVEEIDGLDIQYPSAIVVERLLTIDEKLYLKSVSPNIITQVISK